MKGWLDGDIRKVTITVEDVDGFQYVLNFGDGSHRMFAQMALKQEFRDFYDGTYYPSHSFAENREMTFKLKF